MCFFVFFRFGGFSSVSLVPSGLVAGRVCMIANPMSCSSYIFPEQSQGASCICNSFEDPRHAVRSHMLKASNRIYYDPALPDIRKHSWGLHKLQRLPDWFRTVCFRTGSGLTGLVDKSFRTKLEPNVQRCVFFFLPIPSGLVF